MGFLRCTPPIPFYPSCRFPQHSTTGGHGERCKDPSESNAEFRPTKYDRVRALILFIQTLALYKSFTYLPLTYLQHILGECI